MEQFNQKSWLNLMEGIVKIMRKQISNDKQYAKNIFSNQEGFIEEQTQFFLNQFHKLESIEATFNPEKLFDQLRSKEVVLSKLLFPRKETIENKSNVRIKSRNLERLFEQLESQMPIHEIEINYEGIKNIFREQRKLNRSPELFALDNFLRNQNKEQIYKIDDPPRILEKGKLKDKRKTIKIKLIHSYQDSQALEIIRANISSLSVYKRDYNKMMQNQKVKDVESENDLSKFIFEDNIVNSNYCYIYFAFAMQLEYFNNLLQPVSLQYYLKNFSIFENNLICRGLILGNLASLFKRVEQPQFDTDDEEEYELDFQDFVEEFNAFFQGYFDQVGNQKQEINMVQRNIFNIIYNNKKSSNKKERIREMEEILNKHWGK